MNQIKGPKPNPYFLTFKLHSCFVNISQNIPIIRHYTIRRFSSFLNSFLSLHWCVIWLSSFKKWHLHLQFSGICTLRFHVSTWNLLIASIHCLQLREESGSGVGFRDQNSSLTKVLFLLASCVYLKQCLNVVNVNVKNCHNLETWTCEIIIFSRVRNSVET